MIQGVIYQTTTLDQVFLPIDDYPAYPEGLVIDEIQCLILEAPDSVYNLPDWIQVLIDDPMMYQVPIINERPPVTRLK
jgi:hypothetical protein